MIEIIKKMKFLASTATTTPGTFATTAITSTTTITSTITTAGSSSATLIPTSFRSSSGQFFWLEGLKIQPSRAPFRQTITWTWNRMMWCSGPHISMLQVIEHCIPCCKYIFTTRAWPLAALCPLDPSWAQICIFDFATAVSGESPLCGLEIWAIYPVHRKH